MCGISGVFRTKCPVLHEEVQAMTDRMAHRGPDGSGVKVFEYGGIGHRRLSIIDLEAGVQPMCNEDQSIWITFNGEIYNFLDLRKELIYKGHHFRTSSDTEVLIHGYEQWGTSMVEKLRGMFAFAIVDNNKQIVFSARDHFGIKPFYYYHDEQTFSFASELQAFNNVSGIEKEINLKAIDQYLWLQYIPAPDTIWKRTFKLKPAHYIIYHFNGTLEKPVRYWNIDFRSKRKMSSAEWEEECTQVIRDSVKAHLVSDVAFGAFLSGGIDSTAIVTSMAEIMTEPVKTFSIGFEEEEYNELAFADQVAKNCRTDHHFEIVRPDAISILPELVKHFGEPFGDSSAIPTYYVCRLAAKHVKMVLSGDGGDEAFSGYQSHMHWLKFQAINYRTGLKRKLFPLIQALAPRKYPRTDTLEKWMQNVEYLPADSRELLWKEDAKRIVQGSFNELEALFEETEGLSLANKAQYMDMKSYMPYDILTKVDVTSMVHSLEVRTPLIDKEVWEFAATIPEHMNIRRSPDGQIWEGKALLKNILRKQYGDSFIDRQKKGFAVPLKKWFANNGELHTMLNDYLHSDSSEVFNYFNREQVNKYSTENNSRILWLLLFLEEWLRHNKKSV